MKIGVGITTHNRDTITAQTVAKWRALLPKGAALVVVDDASDKPYPRADFRFEENVGIAVAKNKCFELLEDLGVTDFFLSDNDCYPTHKNWWKPYVKSPEPHLSYQFLDLKRPGYSLNDVTEIYRDSEHVAYSGQRGCMLYFHKSCLEAVGGFDPIYGRALYEHSDLANRIHAAGLTTWRYADVAGSAGLFHSMDEYVEVNRTIPASEQREYLKGNAELHHKRRASNYVAYVPYRPETEPHRDIVMTTLLTSNPDPQRGYKWDPDVRQIEPWVESMERGGWEGVILADELESIPKYYKYSSVETVQASAMNVYYQRWLHIYRYLRSHPEVRWVWCTDGSDVEVMRDPFAEMSPNKLYVGSEPTVVSDPWMISNHPARKFNKLWKEWGNKPLLNAGVVGGDRETVMYFAQQMVTVHDDIVSERFWEIDKSKADIGDMAAFNYVAYTQYASRVSHGPSITTEFKSFKDNGKAKFKHK